MKNFNINNFVDQFGNLKNEFEVICYEKLSNGEWVENRRFDSGRSYFVIDGQLYNVLGGNSLITLNMDFNSETCGACYVIGDTVENRKIIGNETLFTNQSKVLGTLKLKKQSYSDGTAFYSLQDGTGNWKVGYGSNNLNDIIEQLEHELNVYSKYENDPETNEIYKNITDTKKQLIINMKWLINQTLAS